MPTLQTAARNAACNAVVDLLDQGTTNANAQAIFRTVADAEVATLNMSNPAFGDSANGVATAGTIADDADTTGGDTTKLTLEDRDNNEVLELSVATSGADVNVSSTTIGVGDRLSFSTLTVDMPAS